MKPLATFCVKSGIRRENTCRSASDVLNLSEPGKPGATVRTEETLTAGVPEMQKLVETASRTLGIDQKAADAARHDNPKTLSASLDVTESEICAHFIARETCARLASTSR